MKKAVLIPDSFKGTVSSTRVCELMAERIEKIFPGCAVQSIPVADGGEGSVDAFLTAVGGEKVTKQVTGPWFEQCSGYYGLIDNGATAVLEMAAAAGLPMVGDHKDPRGTTTFGVGELLADAARSGAKRLVIGLGGSATNDGGCGAAAAAGVKFYNAAGESFVPVGGTLKDIERIDMSMRDPAFDKVEIVTMCDIDNPMYGETGAAYIFGPQKGADPEMVKFLDQGLRHLSEVIKRDIGVDVADMPGAGAAGAMGAGMVAFFGSRLQMGIETVLDTVEFDKAIADADIIFTGEGKIDSQSLRGKVVIGVARRAAKQDKPVIAIVGGADYDVDAAYGEGVTAIFPINRLPQDFSVLKEHSEENLGFAVENVLRALSVAGM
ncbi:MAG TPA: glycerate kinase [Candidatus Scatomorpha gallistercoris]|nr:glycerate kinase [Candidatus Scatomorpha gallistercoris]